MTRPSRDTSTTTYTMSSITMSCSSNRMYLAHRLLSGMGATAACTRGMLGSLARIRTMPLTNRWCSF